jgi:hypothetical protein
VFAASVGAPGELKVRSTLPWLNGNVWDPRLSISAPGTPALSARSRSSDVPRVFVNTDTVMLVS